ncbi:MAG: cold shock domain-containing protein [Pseudomonadota bacterium]
MTESTVLMSDDNVVRGVVKWFDLGKGFGFVIADGVAQDILLHVNVLRRAGRAGIMAGDAVELAYEETAKGFQATDLISVETEEGDDDAAPTQEADPGEDLKAARLKWFDKGKGYGFVNVFGHDEDVFVHVDILRAAGMLDAQVGEAVCVVITRGAKGASATAVYPWDSAQAWLTAQD